MTVEIFFIKIEIIPSKLNIILKSTFYSFLIILNRTEIST